MRQTSVPPAFAGITGVALIVMGCWLGAQPSHALAIDSKAGSNLLQVGPKRAIKTLAEASKLAVNGSLIEVDAGDYIADVAVWTQNNLKLRAVGGRVRLLANGASAEGKAIWVVRSDQMDVEGFEFSRAYVEDHNGAGIRLERGKLQVRDCKFVDNENGILTSNDPLAELDIVNSEFAHNGYGDGLSHNLYVGAIARLSVTGSYFHHALVGHLLKSRAAVNDIRYNRLADGPGGRASYELEFPNGGLAYVVANVIEQSERTENPHLISYAAEGYRWPANALYLVHNTLVDRKPGGGVFLRVKPGEVKIVALNNLLVGSGQLETAGPGDYRNNVHAGTGAFERGVAEDYRPRRGARSAGKLADIPVSAEGVALDVQAQYLHPASTIALTTKPHNSGAIQTSRPMAKP